MFKAIAAWAALRQWNACVPFRLVSDFPDGLTGSA
jgi:hypothetical protein